MKRLLRFEWKKNFAVPLVGILLLLSLLINGGRIYMLAQDQNVFSKTNLPEWKEAYDTFYEKYSGAIKGDKLQEILGLYYDLKEETDAFLAPQGKDPDSFTYNKYSDVSFLESRFLDPMYYEYSYASYADEIRNKALRNAEYYEGIGGTYEVRTNTAIAEKFEGRKITAFYNTDMYRWLIDYDFSSLLIVILIILCVSTVFAKEQETEMCLLLATSPKGRLATTISKLLATWGFTVGISLLFFVEDFIGCLIGYYGSDSLESPLYILTSFSDTPVSWNLLQSVVCFDLLRVLGFLVIATVLLLLSKLSKKALWTVGINCIAFLSLLFFAQKSYTNLRLINPITLIRGRTMFMETNFVNVSGYPVPDYLVCILLNGLVLVISAAALILLRRKGR